MMFLSFLRNLRIRVFSLKNSMEEIYTVEGISMHPYLKQGDRVIIQRDNFSVKIGDIILLESPHSKTPIIHRMLKAGPKGDYLKNYDHEIYHEFKIIGKYKGKLKSSNSIIPEVRVFKRIRTLLSTLNHDKLKYTNKLASLLLKVIRL